MYCMVTQVSNATTGVVVKPTQDTKLNQQYGYYDFSVNGANTSIAFVPDNAAIQSAKPHPFGVGTHFSQGTNVDLIPLIKKLGVNRIRDNAGDHAVLYDKGAWRFGCRGCVVSKCLAWEHNLVGFWGASDDGSESEMILVEACLCVSEGISKKCAPHNEKHST